MNKLKTIGLSALAGSLALTTAANAVDYAVTGDAYVSWSSQDSESSEAASGKGVAVDTDLYFNASGELDNGFTVSFYQGINTNKTLSQTSGQVTLGMGSMGTLQVNNYVGSKANAIDDVMPNAMQETWDRVADASISDPSFFGGPTNDGSIDYRIPTMELMGVSVNFAYTYDPAVSEESYNASTGGKQTNVSGDAMVLQLSAMGLEIGLGNEEIDNDQGVVAGSAQTNTTGYIKYAMGPLTVGYQESYQNNANGAEDKEGEMWGIAYTSGDISVSYGESEYANAGVSDTASVATNMDSIQIAYTMGAMTISAATFETSNAAGIAGRTFEENELAVSFAF